MSGADNILVVDLGNTFLKLGVFSVDVPGVAEPYFEQLLFKKAVSYGVARDTLCDIVSKCEIKTVAVASVVPKRTRQVLELLNDILPSVSYHLLDPAKDHILKHTITSVETTGIDRLLASRGAWQFMKRDSERSDINAVIVVQAGTAVTVDLVTRLSDTSGNGVFQGGLILPGPQLWLDGLTHTGKIPSYLASTLDWTATGVGNCTEKAVMNGLCLGIPGAVSSAIDAISAYSQQLGAGKPCILLTGGWAEQLEKKLVPPVKRFDDLVLWGGFFHVCGLT